MSRFQQSTDFFATEYYRQPAWYRYSTELGDDIFIVHGHVKEKAKGSNPGIDGDTGGSLIGQLQLELPQVFRCRGMR
jgi:hypothetical protein